MRPSLSHLNESPAVFAPAYGTRCTVQYKLLNLGHISAYYSIHKLFAHFAMSVCHNHWPLDWAFQSAWYYCVNLFQWNIFTNYLLRNGVFYNLQYMMQQPLAVIEDRKYKYYICMIYALEFPMMYCIIFLERNFQVFYL